MPIYDTTVTLELNMRVEAGDPREAMDLVIAQCYAPIFEQISERDVVVLEEDATLVEE